MLMNNKKAKKDYGMLATDMERAHARRKWVGNKVAVVKEQMKQSDTLVDRSGQGFVFRTLKVMCALEHDVEVGCNIAMDCMRRGPKYYRVDTIKKRITYAHGEETFGTDHNKSWGIEQEVKPSMRIRDKRPPLAVDNSCASSSKVEETSSSDDRKAIERANKTLPTPKRARGQHAASQGTSKKSKGLASASLPRVKQEVGTPEPDVKEIKAMEKTVITLIADYRSALGAGQSILIFVESGVQEWCGWLTTSHTLFVKLNHQVSELKELTPSNFSKMLIANDTGVLKRIVPDKATYLTEMTSITDSLATHVAALSKMVAFLNNMHEVYVEGQK